MCLVFYTKSIGSRNIAQAITGSSAFVFGSGATVAGAAVPSPFGLFVDTTTATSVSLDWNDSAQVDHLSYDLQYDTNASFTGPTTVNSISVSNNTVSGLTEGTQYWFRVRDVTTNGTSDWTSSVTATPSGTTTYNVFPFSVPSIFDNDTGVVNANAQWQVTSETPLDGTFSYQNGGGFTYVSGAAGTASFDYQILDYDGLGGNTSATATVNVLPYDLGTLPSNVSNIQFASEPTITSTQTVTTVSELLSSVAVAGRRTIVSAGTYNLTGAIVFAASNSNHWLDLQPGATINSQNDSFWGLQMLGANNIKVTGSTRQSTFNSAIEIGGGCSDLYLDGVRIISQSNEGQNGFTDVTRLTILNSYISGNLFSFYSYSPNNMIVANTQIIAGPEAGKRAAIRMGYANTVAFVDCNIVTQHATDHIIRVEADAHDVWFARCQGENTVGGQGVEQSTVIPGPTIADNYSVYWEDNTWYDPSGTSFLYLQEGGATTQHHDMRMSGERFYTNAASNGSSIYTEILDWSITDSIYQTYTTPPTWSFA